MTKKKEEIKIDIEIVYLLAWMANKLSEPVTYKTWSAEFCKSEIQESHERAVKRARELIDFTKLDKTTARALGFKHWAEGSDLMLIPLWLCDVIPVGTEVSCINGGTHKWTGTEDRDIRFGCVAYGIYIK